MNSHSHITVTTKTQVFFASMSAINFDLPGEADTGKLSFSYRHALDKFSKSSVEVSPYCGKTDALSR